MSDARECLVELRSLILLLRNTLDVLDQDKSPMKNLTKLRGTKMFGEMLRPMVKAAIEQAEVDRERLLVDLEKGEYVANEITQGICLNPRS